MSFYNFFKNIFGIPSGSDDPNDFSNRRRNDYFNEEHRNRNWEEHEDEDYNEQDGAHFGFNVFTDPLEIHRYFEQQLDDMMRSFQGFFRSEENSPFGGGFGTFVSPALPEHPEHEPNHRDLRSRYLKPGYEHARERHPDRPQEDSDLDGKINVGDLDSILGRNAPRQQITPYQQQPGPSTRFFGQSVSTRRVQRPDGSVEIHRTTRDHEGNEETTITRQMGDKQYTVTTKRGKDGKEEKIEDMVNLDEKDVNKFLDSWQGPNQPHHPPDDPNKYFPYDKFFK